MTVTRAVRGSIVPAGEYLRKTAGGPGLAAARTLASDPGYGECAIVKWPTHSRQNARPHTYQSADLAGEETLLDDPTLESPNHADGTSENPDSELARRRKRNRDYMRRRRADPAQNAHEKASREQKQRATSTSSASLSTNAIHPTARMCSLCHIRAAVEEITRLEPSEVTREGYVQVRLPYCGRC